MIVASYIVPHAPFLIPNVGKASRERLHATITALEQAEEKLLLSKPDTLLIISPHSPRYPDAWSANMSPQFTAHMQDFGDHDTAIPARVNYLVLDRIHREMREEKIPFTLRSSEQLDYGYTVPLATLARSMNSPSILPIAPSEQPLEAQFEFGSRLYRVLQREEARIAVIASADLSHHVRPGTNEKRPEAVAFDEAVRQAVRTKSIQLLIDAAKTTPVDIQPCGTRPIALLLGVLQELNTTSEELCYEAPFQVGYLTASFRVA